MAAHAIVMAAGAGSRFGGRKMLAVWKGEPLVLAAVRAALGAPVTRVTVVTGADAGEVEASLAPLMSERFVVTRNPDWRTGLAASLRVGIESLPPDATAAIVFLGDMPLVPLFLAATLLGAVQSGAPAALVDVDGLPGHPVAFSSAMFPLLCRLEGDRGGRPLLEKQPGAVRIQVADRGCLFDVDSVDALG